ncbi:MAG: hypothetical protein LBE16_02620 [Clostridiales Family XIII bacterium]|nr:hypothetical protein [Clostridiales Family XIII bacterium]
MIAEKDLKAVREAVFAARLESGRAAALLESGERDGARLTAGLDELCEGFERAVISLRNLCERTREGAPPSADRAPNARGISVAGSAEISDCGRLHLKLNALLPNCRFGAPAYITDTVTRLLDDLERRHPLPYFTEALLAIEEHCDISSRRVFDQDNKAWKAVSNALKGRLIPDDDGFTLGVALLSEKSAVPACHIYLLPLDEAGDFFYLRQGEYGLP